MEKRKEFFKTIILIFLVCTSIVLTFKIIGYKPDYDILGISVDKQKEEQAREKLQKNTLNLLSPDIITKKNKLYREEVAVENSITKLAVVQAIKNKNEIKKILQVISDLEVEETRIRNKSIEEIINGAENYYIFNYRNNINAVSSKILYLGQNSQTTDFDFNKVVVSDKNKQTLYLYKDNTTYMQIEYAKDVYSEIEKIFKEKNEQYGKYSLDNKFNFYIKEDQNQLYIDEYNVQNIDISNVASNVFLANSNLKVSQLNAETKEITNGYSILREQGQLITYINPSNYQGGANLSKNVVETFASDYLITGYLPDDNYSIINISDNNIEYQEVHKDGLVFSPNYQNNINVKVSADGVHNSTMPSISKETHITSYLAPMFTVENTSAVLNYIFKNLELDNVSDIELGYQKKYNSVNKKITYIPTWYIKYKNEYIDFNSLQLKSQRGEL